MMDVITDSLPLAMAIINEEGIVIEENKQWKNWRSGLTKNKLCPSLSENYITVLDTLSFPKQAEVYKGIRQVITRHTTHYCTTFLHLQGVQDKFISLEINAIADSPFSSILYQDVTKYAKLQERVDLLENVVNHLSEDIRIADKEGSYHFVNATSCKKTKYSFEQLMKKKVWEIEKIFPDKQAWQKHFEEVYTKNGVTTEGKNVRKDQTIYPIEVNVRPVTLHNKQYIVAQINDLTKLKTTEQKLHNQEEKYKLLYNKTPVMLHVLNIDKKIIEVNDYWLEKMGYTLEEIIGKSSTYFLTLESRKRVFQNFSQLQKKDYLRNISYQFVKKNGEVIDVLLSGITHRNDQGQVIGYMGVMIDITEKCNAERLQQELLEQTQQLNEELQASKEKYQQALEQALLLNKQLEESEKNLREAQRIARLGNWIYNRVTKKITWSEEIYRLLEFDPSTETLTFKKYMSYIYPEDRFLIRKVYNYIKKHRVEQKIEIRYILADHSQKYILHTISPVIENGKLVKLYGTNLDITERKQAELALKKSFKSLKEYRFALDIAAIVVITDVQGKILHANDKFSEISGYTKEDLLGKNHKIVNAQHHSQSFFNQMWATIKRGEIWNGEIKNKKKESGYYWVDMTIVPFLDEKGNPIQYLAISFDVTDRVQMKNKLLEIQERLTLATLSANIGIWDWDVLNNKLIWDESMYQLYGINEGDFTGAYEAWTKTLYSDDKTKAEIEIQETLEGIKDFDTEFRIVLPNGKTRYIKALAKNFYNDNQQVSRLIGANWDITQLKEAEEEIKQNKNTLRQIIDLIPHMIYAKDQEGRFVLVNRVVAESLNSTVEELTGKLHQDVHLVSKEVEAMMQNDQKVFQNNSSLLVGEETFTDVYGRQRWLQTLKIPFQDSNTSQKSVLSLGVDITLQKKAQEKEKRMFDAIQSLNQKLKANEELYQLVIKGSSAGIWDWTNIQKDEQWWSPKFYELLGYENKEISASLTNFKELLHPDDYAYTFSLLETHFNKKCPFVIEYRLKTKEKGYQWFLASGQAQWNTRQQPVRIVGSVINVNERKNTEEKLRKQESNLLAIVTSLHDFVFEIDEDARYLNAWTADESVLFLPKEQFLGKTILEILGPDFYQIFEKPLRQVIATQKGQTIEYVNPYNPVQWFAATFNYLPDQYSEKKKISLFVSDITSRKQAEEQLKKRESNLRAIVTSLDDMVFEVTENGLILNAWTSNHRMLGISQENLIGRLLQQVLNDDLSDLFSRNIERAIRSKHTQQIEFLSPFKEHQWISARISYLGYSEEYHKVSVLISDITEKKQAEKELHKAKERAEQAAEAKSQFLSMMSHEIRTPMNAVIGMIHLLQEENPKPEQMENLNILHFSAENLLTLINDILDFSKIESGKIDFEKIEFDLHELGRNISQTFRHKAKEKNIELHHVLPSQLPIILGDPTRLNQILTNLISNAVKFTEKGSVIFKVFVKEEFQDRICLDFEVTDTGIGIPESKQKLVFEPFSQASITISRKFGGTGLGLAIIKNLLEMQGSFLRLKSKPGIGTKFSFTLTFDKKIIKTDSLEDQLPSEQTNTLSDVNLLLVEDRPVNQLLATKFLKKWGITPDYAKNGQIAVDKAKNKNYDIILMDIMMPEMDGYEATRLIREMPSHYTTPIIALTASGINKEKEMAFDAGVTDFVMKPFNPKNLQTKISQYVQNKTNQKINNMKKDIIQLQNIQEIADGDLNLEKEIIQVYIQDLQQVIKMFEEGLNQKHERKIRTAIHNSKASCELLKCYQLKYAFQQGKILTNNPDNYNSKQIELLIAQVKLLANDVIEQLKQAIS